MPRGGGSRGGGGGGGGGGGFRGGGFRGGGVSFRRGSSRPSGRPYGRTGARRTVSRSPSGPYSHARYRPRRNYYRYGYGYWPWYRRWWYRPWWAGRWHRSWYYSPVYMGGGFLIALVLLAVILPIFGVAIWYPFSNADVNGRVNYRATETLYFNEYWYEYENIKSGNDITFSVDSSPSVISFAIFNLPFDNLPTTTKTVNYTEHIVLGAGAYEYYSIFLNSQSTIRYNYTATSALEFFIVDGDNLYYWNYGGIPDYYEHKPNKAADTGMITVGISQDYYVVWYNDGGSVISVDITVNYTAVDVPDITGAYYFMEATDDVPEGTYTVPSSGNWYFFIYFDPMNSPEESTSITFDVSFDTGITAVERWTDAQPFLIGLLVFLIIIILLAFIARSSQRRRDAKVKAREAKKKAKYTKKPKPDKKGSRCERCGAILRKNSNYCHKCSGKISGRKIATSNIKTPSKAKSCELCGGRIKANDVYCIYCGTEIE